MLRQMKKNPKNHLPVQRNLDTMHKMSSQDYVQTLSSSNEFISLV